MKKPALIITAAILTLCMAGCAQNNAKPAAAPAETTTTTPAATTTTTAAPAETTTTTTTAAETTVAEPALTPEEDLKNQKHLFRGYVEAENGAEQLWKAPSDNAEKFDELTAGTILEIYTCDTEGWYLAVLGGETAGYIKADLVKEMPHKLPFGERLFGGYVNTNESINLYSEADESSEVIREIPSGTQLDIYESDYEGWYMTAMANDSDSYDMGFIKTEYIAEIPSYDMDDYTPTLKDIAGEWIYEEQDEGITDQYVGRPVGRYSITDDGKFTYTSDGSTFANGKIGIYYEEYTGGSRVPLYIFYDEGGESFLTCYAEAPEARTAGCLYIGNAGMARLVPAPNAYGFYELKNPPASGVSVAALSGTWNDADKPGNQLVITDGADIYHGSFAFTDENGTTEGVVKLEYLLNPDDTKSFWYTFYLNDGSFWNGFSVSGDIPLNDLYSGQDGALHLVRAS